MNRIRNLAKRLQLFAAEPNVITTQQITVNPREVDFVTSFGNDLSALSEVLGIAQPIRKPNGAQLVGKTVTGTLESGDVPEGEEIPFSQFSVAPVTYDQISIRKYAKALTIETVIENGIETAVGMTDEEFKQQLIDVILADVPCSGEGMFRKDPSAVDEWSIANVQKCQKRQRAILQDIWPCLKPGCRVLPSRDLQ